MTSKENGGMQVIFQGIARLQSVTTLALFSLLLSHIILGYSMSSENKAQKQVVTFDPNIKNTNIVTTSLRL